MFFEFFFWVQTDVTPSFQDFFLVPRDGPKISKTRHLRSSCPWTLSSVSLSCSGCSCLKIFHCSCMVKMILKWSWNVCYFMKWLWILYIYIYYYLQFYIILILNGCESHCFKNNKVTFGDESTAGWSDRHWFRSASSCFSCFLPFVYWFISIFWVYTFFITGNSMSITVSCWLAF